MLAIAHWTGRYQHSEIADEETELSYVGTLRSRRVLVADDNELNRRVIVNVLNRVAAHVVEARNGREALTILNTEHIEAAVLDIQMPDLTGVDVMLAFSAGRRGQKTPFIALTADTTDECRSRCLAAGAGSVLYKPVSAQSLYRELHRIIAGTCGPLDRTLPSCATRDEQERHMDYALLRELALSAQHPGYLTGLITCFKKDGGQLLRELGATLQAGDLAGSRALLHRLKGMSAAIGAEAVARLCRETLSATDNDLMTSWRALVKQLSRSHTEAAEDLDHFLAGKPLGGPLQRPHLCLASSGYGHLGSPRDVG
jgi:two-component system sensor histidine kinase RpfC